MERAVEERKVLQDGKHEGTITAVEYRDKPFEYVDLVIESEECKLKVGYPFKIMPDSKLGKLLTSFGAELKFGSMIDPDEYFINKKCEFMTMQKTTNTGTYANIIPDSVKPGIIMGVDTAKGKDHTIRYDDIKQS